MLINMAESTTETNVEQDKVNDYDEIFDDLIGNIDIEGISSSTSEILQTDAVNDNFLTLLDQYCNETLTNSLTSSTEDNFQIDNPVYDLQSASFDINTDNVQFTDKLPQIFIINQSHQNINSNVEIKNLTQYISNFNNKSAMCSSISSNQSFLDLSSKPHLATSGDLKPAGERRSYRSSMFLLNQCDQTKKKDENFYHKLVSLLDEEDINKLTGEMYTLEYYRSCNKLLATKSRPLANLRHKNKEAEKKHKDLVDLNKKCRSIIRKFKNGPFTIDTLFKWNEQRSMDGPMSCSICRCNKFFKRPGSIANHIYRVHEKILQEALETGELSNVIRDRDKPKPSNNSRFHLYQQLGTLPVTQMRTSYPTTKVDLSINQFNGRNSYQFNHLSPHTITKQ
ncbi:uncharacterized protein [Chelonus insularis]|uniref:uncharacterized protein n=1 Tax=Chelonus insularis TaxID=460826 RepID=UPI00158C306D|nr:uncharacterized protein LOC118069263 [Chelonus insularis]